MSQQVEQISKQNWALFELQAEFCKALSHPTRHAIIQLLQEREYNVTELSHLLGLSQANLSQHLAVLRDAEIVVARRFGVNVSYSIADPAIIRACSIIHRALQNRLAKQEEVISSLDMLEIEVDN